MLSHFTCKWALGEHNECRLWWMLSEYSVTTNLLWWMFSEYSVTTNLLWWMLKEYSVTTNLHSFSANVCRLNSASVRWMFAEHSPTISNALYRPTMKPRPTYKTSTLGTAYIIWHYFEQFVAQTELKTSLTLNYYLCTWCMPLPPDHNTGNYVINVYLYVMYGNLT